jgi:hypothetical protein
MCVVFECALMSFLHRVVRTSFSCSLQASSLSAKPTNEYFWVDFMMRDPKALEVLQPAPDSGASSVVTSPSSSLSSIPSTASSASSFAPPGDCTLSILSDVHRFIDSCTGRTHPSERGPILGQLLGQYVQQLNATEEEFSVIAEEIRAFIVNARRP